MYLLEVGWHVLHVHRNVDIIDNIVGGLDVLEGDLDGLLWFDRAGSHKGAGDLTHLLPDLPLVGDIAIPYPPIILIGHIGGEIVINNFVGEWSKLQRARSIGIL